MKTLLAFLSILLVTLALPASAAKKDKGGSSAEAHITAVDPTSITVSLGKAGDDVLQYKINEKTKVTLNGTSIAVRDLRAGMVCKIEADANHMATSVAAKDAPAHSSRHRAG